VRDATYAIRSDLLRIAYCVSTYCVLRIAYCVLRNMRIGSGWGTLFAIAYCVLRIAYCVLRDTVWTVLRQFRHIRTTIDGTDGLLLVRVNDAG
jgi:hypothetical protein